MNRGSLHTLDHGTRGLVSPLTGRRAAQWCLVGGGWTGVAGVRGVSCTWLMGQSAARGVGGVGYGPQAQPTPPEPETPVKCGR